MKIRKPKTQTLILSTLYVVLIIAMFLLAIAVSYALKGGSPVYGWIATLVLAGVLYRIHYFKTD